ncbi:MAG: tRNA (N6-threonylcarbamoyladenosine(37)-N6)-methyltransferase TrmO [Bacteroidales bacterium]|nr:tRNA (N6-threonylcarbamoyladenosine(37)-N6)-methyltransferase TrmO [Bacteroidales bacterium]
MKVIARIRTPFAEKFGVPRQSSLAPHTRGVVVFEPEFRRAEALRGLEGFDWIWLIWEFSENGSSFRESADELKWQATVRPPRLGGNKRMGVFATRSTFRPNPIGLSSVRLLRVIEQSPDGPLLEVAGADLVDGTPIYDIKPYIPYSDSHPDADCGWLKEVKEKRLRVVWPEEAEASADEAKSAGVEAPSEDIREQIEEILSLDPRPSYQSDNEKLYGLSYGGWNIRFRVDDNTGELFIIQLGKS